VSGARAVGALHEREAARFRERTPGSAAMYERARRSLAGGVASSFHGRDPWPVYTERGEGCRVWDVDGNEYIDFHNGFSAMVQGHAHPAIGTALAERYELGTHFGATTEDAVAVAEELGRRFGLPRWRFTSSGTESNMAAIRLARAATGRSGAVKMQGAYHGHDDSTIPWREGVPAEVAGLVHEVPFNDPAALETLLADLAGAGREPACVITEGAMTSVGLVPPEPGYLAAVRELTRRHGVLLVLDEVKTGLTIAAGGAVERFGAEPDVVTLAKSLGAGLPAGAIGMTGEVGAPLVEGRVRQVGTYNGNPLSMAAARASLEQVLTPEAYVELERLGARMVDGCRALLAEDERVVGIGCKGCVHGHDDGLAELLWLWLMNRGIFVTPNRGQEWNVTVAHDDDAVDRYLGAFAGLLNELGPRATASELSPRSSGSARA
jgi:glutamate-1-semialdehyde 2,1-aminomutase